ncbi:MAG: CpcT/CpeT family chromophore lyase [Cyanobacteria bacterium P01_A01_bin.135]
MARAASYLARASTTSALTSVRQRVLMLEETDGQLVGQYFAFKQPGQFKGAGQRPEMLAAVTEDDLTFLPGCVLDISYDQGRFKAQMRPGDRCRFEFDGKVGQVVLGFEVAEQEFLSYDRGVNPETEKPIWGALMGPYQFSKERSYAQSLPL